MGDDPWTFFGTWSLKDKLVVESILTTLTSEKSEMNYSIDSLKNINRTMPGPRVRDAEGRAA